jgi:TM2 domain-containing membrane protein YozV
MKKSKLATILLALFLGSLGIHRFYLDQIVYGILYLVLACTGISTLLAIIDVIIFLVMSDEEFNIRYCK